MKRLREMAGAAGRRVVGIENWARWRICWAELHSNRRVFGRIYRENLWGSSESVSGMGSTLEFSEAISGQLPVLLAELGAETLLDAGCGDFNWLKTLDLGPVKYIGVDVVKELIQRNSDLYGSDQRLFILADITRDRLPAADVVLCRHCLIHLSNRQVQSAIRNFAASGAKYLLATTTPGLASNHDIQPGGFRPVNLEMAPFQLSKPLRIICDSRDEEKPELGLWRLDG